MKKRILVVDDNEGIRKSLSGSLSDEGYEVLTAVNGREAIEAVEAERPDLLLLDIWMPEMDGMDVLAKLREEYPGIPVIMISGHGTIETAVKATKLGAYDFIEKPLSLEKIIITINHALNEMTLAEEVKRYREQFDQSFTIIGESPPMRKLKEEIAKAAPTDSYILITGESGTGKELVARALFGMSNREGGPFIEVNCAAIPEELIESELFGYERGAFTGATKMKMGKFDLASGGTIFLDEIGDMSVKTQAKILRILQEQNFVRVGGTKPITVDVRVFAATNQNLEKKMKDGSFREDLFFRLNVLAIDVPPLRERIEDIPLLADYFVEGFARDDMRRKKKVTKEAMGLLMRYRWQGNVRELKNIVERLIIMSPGATIGPEDVPLYIKGEGTSEQGNDFFDFPNLREAKDNFERLLIQKKLEENDNNITKTAEALGIERSHLHKKLKAYHINFEKE